MKTLLKWIAVAAIVAAVALVAPAASAQSAPYCGITWGSLPKEASPGSGALLTDVRVGQHGCYDRLVLDMVGDVRGYSVRYVDQVRFDGSGQLVPLRGGARLEVVARAGSFEGQTTIGLGVRARLPFRVLILDGPGDGSRLVIDVAHRW